MTADDVIRLGAEETFIRMLLGRAKQGRSTAACNATYLYAIHGAIHDLDWRDLPNSTKERYKAMALELRQSGQFTG